MRYQPDNEQSEKRVDLCVSCAMTNDVHQIKVSTSALQLLDPSRVLPRTFFR